MMRVRIKNSDIFKYQMKGYSRVEKNNVIRKQMNAFQKFFDT